MAELCGQSQQRRWSQQEDEEAEERTAASPPTCVMNKSQLLSQHLHRAHPSLPTETIRDTFWFHTPQRSLVPPEPVTSGWGRVPQPGESVFSCHYGPKEPRKPSRPSVGRQPPGPHRWAAASTRAPMQDLGDYVSFVCEDGWNSTSALR